LPHSAAEYEKFAQHFIDFAALSPILEAAPSSLDFVERHLTPVDFE